MRNLEDMLQTLQKNSLTCNPAKCELGFSKLEFLFFEIGQEGVKISRRKFAVIEKNSTTYDRKISPANTWHVQLLAKIYQTLSATYSE